MRALLLALVLVTLAGCDDPVRQVSMPPFAPPPGADRAEATRAASTVSAPMSTGCDFQNSTLQDSGLPLLLVSPRMPRGGEPVTVTSVRVPPGAHTLTLLAPRQPEVKVAVSVDLDGRLRATFPMPPFEPGLCAVIFLDGTGIQSLGFLVAE